MKKLFVTLLVVVAAMVAPNSAKAIEDPFQKGTLIFGVQGGYYPGFGGSVYGDCVLVDSWWKGHFAVGAHLGFRHWGTHYNDFALAPRASYGLNITDKFEAHVAVVAGLGFESYPYVDYIGGDYVTKTKFAVGLCYGTLVGARYFFSDSFGVSAEVGYIGYAPYTNVGVCFKF